MSTGDGYLTVTQEIEHALVDHHSADGICLTLEDVQNSELEHLIIFSGSFHSQHCDWWVVFLGGSPLLLGDGMGL